MRHSVHGLKADPVYDKGVANAPSIPLQRSSSRRAIMFKGTMGAPGPLVVKTGRVPGTINYLSRVFSLTFT